MFKRQTFCSLALALLLLLTAFPALALPKAPEETLVLGNTPANSLHGGWMAMQDGTFFWADHTGIYADDTLLTTEPGRNLNIVGKGLYFTVGQGPTALHRFDLLTGEMRALFTWDTAIDQLYLTEADMALFLSEGRVHRMNLRDHTVETDEAVFPVVGFIPTVYGTIYATGSLGGYRLYAGNRLIEAGVTLFFTEDSNLILRRGTEDFEIAFTALFSVGAISPMAYEPRASTEMRLIPADETFDDNCPHCFAAFLGQEQSLLPLNLAPSQEIVTYSLPLSQAQQNIVRRARQQMEIRWTPLQDITGWMGGSVFRAGQTYVGIPYAQPINRGAYVPWARTFDQFMAAIKDANSPMYTSFSYIGTHATIAPFYGSDCSAFVSWALAQPRRTTTHSFPSYAHRITQDIHSIQVGDVFNSPNHNLIITAVEYNAAGQLVAVETMEQTFPLPVHSRFGVGGNAGGLEQLVARTFGSGFALYRSNFLADGDVPFTPSLAVNVDPGPRHTITATAGAGGVMSPAGATPVPHGYNQRFVFHPNPGFQVSRILVDGIPVAPDSQFIFTNVTRDARIEVEFALSSSPFVDVREGDWFYDGVIYTFRNDLLRGTSNTHFSPHATTTRGMFVTVLARMAEVDSQDYSFTGTVTGTFVNVRSGPSTAYEIISQARQGDSLEIIGRSGNWYRIRYNGQIAYIFRQYVSAQRGTFTDVTPGAFYAPYVEWANAMGITSGTGGGRFSPSQTMSRQEMATLLYRYITAMDISLGQSNNAPPFTDIDNVATWAVPAVTALQRAGIIQGAGGAFDPLGHSNRASVATMIMNFHQIYG